MYWIYSSLLAVVLLLGLPYWLWQALRHGKDRLPLAGRLGRVPARYAQADVRSIWIHAVSVGEVLAITNLALKLRTSFPARSVLVSTTTAAGQKLAREKFGDESVFYFPIDLAFAIRPYLRALRPELIILAETEFWPNFLRLAHNYGAKIAVVNARISDRSLPGYARFPGVTSKLLKRIDIFLAQTDEDARRLKTIGAPADRLEVSGNLKFDIAIPSPPAIVEKLRRALKEADAGPVLVCGSTVSGEEPLLLPAFENVLASYPRALMILAPRHPQRFSEVAQLLQRLGIRFWLRSQWEGQPLSGGVLLLDTIGELAAIYALADVAFVGGSLVPSGGHNIIEPAQHGVPIVVGNHTENFRDIMALFQSRNAVRVAGAAEFPLVVMELISNDAERTALGRRAAETAQSQAGATQKTLEALSRLLGQTTAGKQFYLA